MMDARGVPATEQFVENMAERSYGFNTEFFGRFAASNTLRDPAYAYAWAQKHADGPHGKNILRYLAARWGFEDGPAAMAWVIAIPSDDRKAILVERAWRSFTLRNREAARAWMRDQTPTPDLEAAYALYLVGTADEDPEAALALEPVTDVGSRYVDFLFPGLLGMNLMGTGMWAMGFAIADFRRRKFLKRLMVTPMRRSSFFLGFMNSRLVFLALELLVLVGFGRFVLGIPFRGDVLSFAIIALLGAFTFAGMGILVASACALLWALAVAVGDESIQSQLASRTGSLRDVAIDVAGATTAVALTAQLFLARKSP